MPPRRMPQATLQERPSRVSPPRQERAMPMQAERFDHLTKGLATGASRRTLLRTLAGGVGGTLLAVMGREQARAQGRPPRDTSCRTNAECGTSEFCEHRGGCRSPGICRPRPEFCIEIYQPVCGCDGQTYASTCHAHRAGVSVARPGECRPRRDDATGQFCGGIAALPCPEGYKCVDDPNDTCDPSQGGADCGGICVAV